MLRLSAMTKQLKVDVKVLTVKKDSANITYLAAIRCIFCS